MDGWMDGWITILTASLSKYFISVISGLLESGTDRLSAMKPRLRFKISTVESGANMSAGQLIVELSSRVWEQCTQLLQNAFLAVWLLSRP